MHDTQHDLAALAWLQRVDPGIEQRPIVVVHETAPTAVLPDFVIRFAEQLFRLPADPVDLEGTVLAAGRNRRGRWSLTKGAGNGPSLSTRERSVCLRSVMSVQKPITRPSASVMVRSEVSTICPSLRRRVISPSIMSIAGCARTGLHARPPVRAG
jgi:hypothetical protein